MLIIAIKMLLADKGKYFGIVLGVTLASLVITQQGAIFTGIMSRTFATVTDMGDPDIWVMDTKVQYIDDIKPLQSTALGRVRSVEGVAWAAPLYKGMLRARLDNGEFQNCVVLGLDDATLAGGPPSMIEGELEFLRRSDAVIVDAIGARTRLAQPDGMGGKRPLRVGDTIEINDRRGVVVGICQSMRTFQSQPVVYTTYSRATHFAPRERKLLSFVLVKAMQGVDHKDLCDRIEAASGLAAYTRDQWKWKTVMFYIENTGIPINFGIAVSLGLLIGAVITGFMFYSFIADNIRYLGTLKAMGATDATLMNMVLVQALIVGTIGFGLGAGLASLFGAAVKRSPLAFLIPWQLLVVSGSAVTVICLLAAMLSMRRVMTLEPAMVFKG
ncbi:MAG: FtsX-like permease family protein [Phycisphaerales bacterium]|nr:FtsX-like permease family protein [Phycisphaerales bacterium]